MRFIEADRIGQKGATEIDKIAETLLAALSSEGQEAATGVNSATKVAPFVYGTSVDCDIWRKGKFT